MNFPSSDVHRKVPDIVHIVLPQLARVKAERQLTTEQFEKKLKRLTAEELAPRNLHVVVRDLSDGATRFIIKEMSNGNVCDLLDCRCDGHHGDGAARDGEAGDDGSKPRTTGAPSPASSDGSGHAP